MSYLLHMKIFSLFLMLTGIMWQGCAEGGQEHYGKVLPAAVPAEPQVQSGADADGAVLELHYRADIDGDVLAMRREGRLYYLYHRNPVGIYPAQPCVTQRIEWLAPGVFACLSAGRRLSSYTIYRLAPDDDAPGTLHVWKLAEGSFTWRVEWKVSANQLSAFNRYGDMCMLLQPVFRN